jgi:hypothetical protein
MAGTTSTNHAQIITNNHRRSRDVRPEGDKKLEDRNITTPSGARSMATPRCEEMQARCLESLAGVNL